MGKTEVVTGHIVVIGFIGSHLTDRLLADGHAVVGIDSLMHSNSRTLRPSAAGADIHMLPKRR